MIQLYKIEEPEVLRKNADKWKEELESYINPKDYLKRRYNKKEVKSALIKETRGKCAYCESKILHVAFGHIEHILPQSKFVNKTFEWGNLTIACEKCNINKGNYYDEEYSVLNPYEDKIEEHVKMIGSLIISKTYRGKVSIDKLDLNRANLLERRQESIFEFNRLLVHYNEAENPIIKEMYYKEIQEHLEDNTEYIGTLRTIEEELQVV